MKKSSKTKNHKKPLKLFLDLAPEIKEKALWEYSETNDA